MFVSSVYAFTVDEELVRANLDKVDLSDAPRALRFVLGKPKVNIEVNGDVYGFKLAGNKVKDFVVGGIENPHYLIKIPPESIEKIVASEDPASTVGELYLAGEIVVEPQRLGAKIKFWIAKKFMKKAVK
jgi:hypothetical protein